MALASLPTCPLRCDAFYASEKPMGFQHWKKIKAHIAANRRNCPHPSLKDLIFEESEAEGFSIKGSTPLLMACFYGELATVKDMVGRLGFDVNLAATYYVRPFYYDDDSLFGKIEKAAPLFVAAARGHVDIVRYLVEKGADISAKTSDPLAYYNGVTPLYGAVSDKYCHFRNAASLFGKPEEESFAVVKLLIESGADPSSKATPGFSPITKAAHLQNWTILDFFLERNDISRIEKIDALELAGAVILSDTEYAPLFPKAFECWRRSLQLRLEDTDGSGPIVKTSPKNLETGLVVEWSTAEELENIIQDRTEQEIQSFLVQSRILGATKNWDVVRSLFSKYVGGHYPSDLSCHLEEQGRFADHLSILWPMLEIIRLFDRREKRLWLMTLTIAKSLNQTLIELGGSSDPRLNAKFIETSLELMLATDQFHLDDRESFNVWDDWHLHCYMLFFLDLIEMLADQPQLMNENSMKSLSGLVSQDQRRHPKKGSSLLHMACAAKGLSTVDLLLRAGADPNAGERNGNGPLHVLAESMKNSDDINDAVARLLLEKGSHLDRVNDEGKTAADVWIENHAHYGGRKRRRSGEQMADPKNDLPSWLRPDDPVSKLKCQCAKVIRSHGVPYKHLLPPSLQAFVSWH